MDFEKGLRWKYGTLIGLAAVWLLARLIGLASSPPGFYIDELGGALNSICLRETGHTFYGVRWPLFPVGAGGGIQSPSFIYLGAVWTAIFGNSVAAFRSLPAVFSIGTVIGLFCLARVLVNSECAFFVAFAASLSPWGFQFARISWDVAIFPFFIVWGLFFLFRSGQTRDAILAGLSFTTAAYTYSSGKVQAPLLLFAVFLMSFFLKPIRWKTWIVFAATLLIVSIPLIQFTMTPEGMARARYIGIITPEYLRNEAGGSWLTLAQIFGKNMALHFSPNFLIFHGDANGRHSTQHVGELGWVDILAFALAIAGLFRLRRPDRATLFIAMLCGAGILSGIVPAALTWDSLPHSLRSSGAWPFVAFASGWILWVACREHPQVFWALAAVALGFTLYFGRVYFRDYPRERADWFDAGIMARAHQAHDSGNWDPFLKAEKTQWPPVLQYYSILYEGESCDSSARRVALSQASN